MPIIADNSQVNVTCSAVVEGQPDSKMQRTYQIVVRQSKRILYNILGIPIFFGY